MATTFPTFHLSPPPTNLCLFPLTLSPYDYDFNCSITYFNITVPLVLFLTLAFGLAVWAFEAVLDFRQRRATFIVDVPEKLMTIVDGISVDKPAATTVELGKEGDDKDKEKDTAEKPKESLSAQITQKFASTQDYTRAKVTFSLYSSLFSILENTTTTLLGSLPFFWRWSEEASLMWFGWTRQDELKVSCVFFIVTSLASLVMGLPFELYQTFYIEKTHGFNKTTPLLFITDKLKSLLLTVLIGPPIIILLLYIIKHGGNNFYMYAWGFMFVFSVVMMTVVPVFIMPLFNKYDPLPDGTLKTSIYGLADRLSYPLTKLFVVDGSSRSSHSNAYMYGFGKNKRIVLYDTLLTQVEKHEILAILGHELGHWKLNHSVINFCVTQAYLGSAFYFFGICRDSPAIYTAFGFSSTIAEVPTFISLLLFFTVLWAPVDKILSFLLTLNSRRCEFQADEFSLSLGMTGLQSGLTKIHIENMSCFTPDWLYSLYHYSHPPLVERLEAMSRVEKRIVDERKSKAD